MTRKAEYSIIQPKEYKNVIEHELNNDKNLLEIAINFIKVNNIVKKKIKFVYEKR